MNTSTAATQAGVTTATIRTWCRIGAVKAAKVAGRWIIDTASLAYRVALSAKPEPVNADTMTAIGGSRWTRNGLDRVYLNGWTQFIGLETTNYKSGRISSATLNGEEISNGEAYRLAGAVDKVYYDVADGKLRIKWGFEQPRSMDRDDLAAAIFSGIRNAIAAL